MAPLLLLPRRALARRATQAASRSVPRRMQQTAAAGGGAEEEPPKYKPGIFSRNPGVTLGGIVLAIGLYVYRSSRGKRNFEAVQTPIADAAVISPYEAWELRSSNNITPERFEAVRDGAQHAFPAGKTSMQQFDQYLGFKLADVGLRRAHHLERVMLTLPRDEEQKVDVDALLVALSMAVKGATDERLRCLFNLATRSPAISSDDDAAGGDPSGEMSQGEIERLLQLLLETFQIPSEKRVVPVAERKYPFQEYKAADAHDLLEAAVQAQVDNKQLSADEANARAAYTFEAFSQIMRSKQVCLWGECFANARKRMKN